MRRVTGAIAVALAVLCPLGRAATSAEAQPLPAPAWATTQAVELTRQGKEAAARGETDVATRRFMQAIEFDATHGPAYLALGELYEQMGDPREGERAYSMGLEHVARFADGYLARSRLRMRQLRRFEAISDLLAAADLRPEDVSILQTLVAAYVSANVLPAALATTRRIEALAAHQRDDALVSSTHVTARALARLVREVDPVTAGMTDRGSVRRALALHADRR